MLNFFRNFCFVSGFSAVALGAFAAHGLKSVLNEYQSGIWETAVFYQFVHTLLLLFVCTNEKFEQQLKTSQLYLSAMLATGILLFSGSLYILALTGVSKFGMVTPIGGTLFLISWIYLIPLYRKLS